MGLMAIEFEFDPQIDAMVIRVIGLLVLGPKRLPELARSLGRGLAEFRRASTEMRREFMDVAEEARAQPPNLTGPDAQDPPTTGANAGDEAPDSASPESPAGDERKRDG